VALVRVCSRYIDKYLATEMSRLAIAGTLTDNSVVTIDATPARGAAAGGAGTTSATTAVEFLTGNVAAPAAGRDFEARDRFTFTVTPKEVPLATSSASGTSSESDAEAATGGASAAARRAKKSTAASAATADDGSRKGGDDDSGKKMA